MQIPNRVVFKMGQLLLTPGALEALQASGESPWSFLSRHLAGDWGELPEEDRQLNDQAVEDGDRILSAYRTTKGDRVWVITEADRSATTILLPGEY